MRQDLEQQLKRRFPTLYPPHFTFYVADGWFDVLWALSDDLERMGLALPVRSKLNVQQVKEKFGALRFYVTHAPEEIRQRIQKAQADSERTCELCGQPGQIMVKSFFWAARCPACIEADIRQTQNEHGYTPEWLTAEDFVEHHKDRLDPPLPDVPSRADAASTKQE